MERADAWMAAASAGLVVAAGLVAATASDRTSVAIAFVAAVTVQIAALRATGNLRGPVVLVPILTFATVGLAGFLFYPTLAPGSAVSATLATTDATYLAAAQTFLVAGVGFTGGALVVLALSPRAPVADVETLRKIRLRPGLLALCGWATLGLLLLGKGAALLAAPSYLAADGPDVAVSVGTSLTFPALLALAVAAARGAGVVKVAAWVGLASWTVVLFAIATRQLAVLPILILFARHLGTDSRPRLLPIALTAACSMLLLQLALTLRLNAFTGHGLNPYTRRVADDPGLLWQLDPAAIFGNILFSVPLTGRVAASATQLPSDYFWTSVSPLLGGMTDWRTIAPTLRVNDFTPFSGLGELANYGLPTLAAYMVIAGALFAWMDLSSRRMGGVVGVVAQLLVVGFAILFALFMLQYNLRSGTRIIYYSAALVVGLRIWLAVRPSDGRVGDDPSGVTPRLSSRSAIGPHRLG